MRGRGRGGEGRGGEGRGGEGRGRGGEGTDDEIMSFRLPRHSWHGIDVQGQENSLNQECVNP